MQGTRRRTITGASPRMGGKLADENGVPPVPINTNKNDAAKKRDRVLRLALYAGGILFIMAIFVYHFRGTISYYSPAIPSYGSNDPASVPLDYSTVAGYFQQDDSRTQDWVFDFKRENFGLVTEQFSSSDGLGPWQRFENWVNQMNKDATDGETFRVLFVGRAVESKHNVASGKYGPEDFNNFRSKHPGDAQLNWTDPQITVRGKVETERNYAFMSKQLSQHEMPAPQSYYVSPLARTLDTAQKNFHGLDLPPDRPFHPIVKEDLRETHGIRMCDKRSSKTWITEHFPNFELEEGFPFEDERWNPEYRETDEQHEARVHRFLDDIFAKDRNTWISLTAHAGTTKHLLDVIGHRQWTLKMGEIVPVLVRAKPHKDEKQEEA